jgi:hypothetical protein
MASSAYAYRDIARINLRDETFPLWLPLACEDKELLAFLLEVAAVKET